MTQSRTYRTNLRCAGCLDALRPQLDTLDGVQSWNVELEHDGKPLTVVGDVPPDQVAAAVARAGYTAVEEASSNPVTEPKPSYYPLVLIVLILLAATAALEWSTGSLDFMRAMRHFMAGFFIVFSFFKLLDLPGFAASYRMYDLVAEGWPAYGFIYPFLELILGLAYAANVAPLWVNVATLALMLVGTAGVVRTIRQKRQVKCACLGTVINLPVATVTLLEDTGMAAMAAAMLIMQ